MSVEHLQTAPFESAIGPSRVAAAAGFRSKALTATLSAFLVYLVLEGVFRKWVSPGQGTLLFLIKDLILLAAVSGYCMHRVASRRSLAPVLTAGETVFFALWIFYFAGSALASGLSRVSLVGLRYYLIMLPLVVLVPRLAGSIERILVFGRRYLYLALPVGLLGIAQFASPPDALINRYAWEASRVATFQGGITRITGTFSYISPFTAYLQFMVFAAWSVLLLEKSLLRRIVAVVILVLLQVNVVLTGSRAALFMTLGLSAMFIITLSRRAMNKRTQLASWAITILILLGGFFQAASPFILIAERHEIAADARERVEGFLLMPFYTYAQSSLLGKGIGSAFMGGRALGWSGEEAEFDEVTTDRIGIETGAVGYTLALGAKIYFMWLALVFLRRLRRDIPQEENLRIVALFSLSFQVCQLWMVPVYSSVANAYYLLSVGLLLWARCELRRLRSCERAGVLTT